MGISSVTGTWEVGDNWPYPKLFFTDYYIIAAAMKGINVALYDMTNSGNIWTATEKIDLGLASDIISIDVASSDKYNLIVVNKGTTKEVYERDPLTGTITSTLTTVIPGGNSCCFMNGQFFICGLVSSGEPWASISKCSVAWSDIGSNIFLPGNELYSSDITAGYRKLPWDENGNNELWKVLALNNTIVVYGNHGIAILRNTMVDQYHAMEMKEVSSVGIKGTYYVNGDSQIHCFIDINNDLNILTSEGLKNLGYRREMEKLGDDIIVSYEKTNKRFYISDGLLCYVFNQNGLYSTHQCVTSIGDYKGILTGFVKDNSDNNIRITTTPFDGGVQGNKTIEAIESDITYNTTGDTVINGIISTKYDYRDDFISTGTTQLNPRGIFTKKTTGREFKVSLLSEYETNAEFSFNSLITKIKFSDKRNIRGRVNVN